MAARSRPRTAESLAAAGGDLDTVLRLGSSRMSCVRPSFHFLPVPPHLSTRYRHFQRALRCMRPS